MSHIRTSCRGFRNSEKRSQRKAEAETGGKAYRGLDGTRIKSIDRRKALIKN